MRPLIAATAIAASAVLAATLSGCAGTSAMAEDSTVTRVVHVAEGTEVQAMFSTGQIGPSGRPVRACGTFPLPDLDVVEFTLNTAWDDRQPGTYHVVAVTKGTGSQLVAADQVIGMPVVGPLDEVNLLEGPADRLWTDSCGAS